MAVEYFSLHRVGMHFLVSPPTKLIPCLKEGGVHTYINQVMGNVLDGEEVDMSKSHNKGY
jgi:hypothetical protein